MPSIRRVAIVPQLPEKPPIALPERYRDLIRRDPLFQPVPRGGWSTERTTPTGAADSGRSRADETLVAAVRRPALVTPAWAGLLRAAAAFAIGVAVGGLAVADLAGRERPREEAAETASLVAEMRESQRSIEHQGAELAGVQGELDRLNTSVAQLRDQVSWLAERFPVPDAPLTPPVLRGRPE